MRWLHGITNAVGMSLSKLRETVKDRGAWRAIVHWVVKDQTEQQQNYKLIWGNIPLYKVLLSHQHDIPLHFSKYIFILKIAFIYILIFGCTGSSLLHGLSLVAKSRECSLVLICGLLLAMASLLQSSGSRAVVVEHRLSCSEVFGIFLDQGSNPCPLRWQTDGFQPTVSPGKSSSIFLTPS